MKSLLDESAFNVFLKRNTKYVKEQDMMEGSSVSEELMRVYMRHIFGANFDKQKPPWLVGARGGQMELDGYNEELRIAFECDGPYHYNRKFLIAKLGLTGEQADRKIEAYKKNDAIKDKECNKKEIILIRLRPEFVKFSDYQKYIEEEYERLTGNPSPHRKPLNHRIAVRFIRQNFIRLDFFL